MGGNPLQRLFLAQGIPFQGVEGGDVPNPSDGDGLAGGESLRHQGVKRPPNPAGVVAGDHEAAFAAQVFEVLILAFGKHVVLRV